MSTLGSALSSQQLPMVAPGGRLTLTTATPVMIADAANQTTIYFTPYKSGFVHLYDGTVWDSLYTGEISIAMAASANWAVNSNYDLYLFNDAGTIRLVTGAAWTNDTTRSEALGRADGIWTNNASMTGRYAPASTVTVPANQGLYVGTMRTTAATGTTTWEVGGAAVGGDPVLLYLWNYYNRVPVSVMIQDTTDSWAYTTAAWRSANNSTSNRFTIVRGLDEDGARCLYVVSAANSASNASGVGMSLDATTTLNGGSSVNTGTTIVHTAGTWSGYPGLGLHFIQAIEWGGGTGTTTWYGDNAGADPERQMSIHGEFFA